MLCFADTTRTLRRKASEIVPSGQSQKHLIRIGNPHIRGWRWRVSCFVICHLLTMFGALICVGRDLPATLSRTPAQTVTQYLILLRNTQKGRIFWRYPAMWCASVPEIGMTHGRAAERSRSITGKGAINNGLSIRL